GYLQREINTLTDDLAFTQHLETTEEEVLEMLKVIQKFDPPGIGARTLQECLLLQLERKSITTPALILAREIIRDFFQDFIKKHYDKILAKARITEDDLRLAIEEIQKLNPKPGGSISEVTKVSPYVFPDFIITNHNEELELSMNSYSMPELTISRHYAGMLHDYSVTSKKSGGRKITRSDKAAIEFIKQKIASAKGFIDALKQRNDTLFSTMLAIMEYQREYFLTGDDTRLRPMILKDIATIVNLDISTISRVANSKYVQTPFGTLLLKSFFSESMQNDKGEEISNREIKKILKDCIGAEDKSVPLTDEQLVDTLKDRGYPIARRTVAKYRELLGIPVARLRREF
ncbi:MAG: RNA polymerase factor sigma-54, partial [Bacteroidota bacterium]